MSIDLDSFLKLIQIIFYFTAGIVAALTYISAKNGLLNTVNTEYHKKIIERLYTLSEDLYAEFDTQSPHYWVNDKSSKELVERINEQVRNNKEAIVGLSIEDFPVGIPHVATVERFENLHNKYRSDPFLPEPIRSEVVSLFKARAEAMHEAHVEAAEYYFKYLAQGKGWDDLDENEGWIHNKIIDKLYRAGVGVSQVEERMHKVRLQIQDYFSQFNPLRRRARAVSKSR